MNHLIGSFRQPIQRYFLGLCTVVLLFSMGSCGVNKDLMFKTPTDYEFDKLAINDSAEYKISVNDQLQFRLYTNNGFVLIDITGGEQGNNMNSGIYRAPVISYLVEMDGMVKLPTLGRVMLAGMTIKEAEQYLEKEYEGFYRKPFVILQVRNRRAIVSTGMGGMSRVITLENNNVTLIEALALAGGIAERGNASNVKVIRNAEDGSKEVYQIDLSTIEGIQMGDMIIQANDIIYVEPVPRVAQELLQDVAPIVSLITSGFVILNFISSN